MLKMKIGVVVVKYVQFMKRMLKQQLNLGHHNPIPATPIMLKPCSKNHTHSPVQLRLSTPRPPSYHTCSNMPRLPGQGSPGQHRHVESSTIPSASGCANPLSSSDRPSFDQVHPGAISPLPLEIPTTPHDRNALIHNPFSHTQIPVHPALDLGRIRERLGFETGAVSGE